MRDRVPAGHHGLLGGSVVFFGMHPKSKRRFVVQSIEGGGWGGRPTEDGESATVSVCQGDVRNGSIEGIELKCPVVVESRGLRQDSCGSGKYRGGLGIDVRVRNLVEGRWNFEQARRLNCPPWGLWGGTAGEVGGYLLRLPGENEFKPIVGAHIPVPLHAEAIVRTGGGGGWGDPLERDLEQVRSDVQEELVSPLAAREHYGVVFGSGFAVDEAATKTTAGIHALEAQGRLGELGLAGARRVARHATIRPSPPSRQRGDQPNIGRSSGCTLKPVPV